MQAERAAAADPGSCAGSCSRAAHAVDTSTRLIGSLRKDAALRTVRLVVLSATPATEPPAGVGAWAAYLTKPCPDGAFARGAGGAPSVIGACGCLAAPRWRRRASGSARVTPRALRCTSGARRFPGDEEAHRNVPALGGAVGRAGPGRGVPRAAAHRGPEGGGPEGQACGTEGGLGEEADDPPAAPQARGSPRVRSQAGYAHQVGRDRVAGGPPPPRLTSCPAPS